jgi:hypothetical protein
MTTPIRQDEVELRRAVIANGGRAPLDYPWTRRLYAMLDKWDRKGWWDSGVTLRSGWLTTKGEKAFAEWANS